jgi:hypothetical protein
MRGLLDLPIYIKRLQIFLEAYAAEPSLREGTRLLRSLFFLF